MEMYAVPHDAVVKLVESEGARVVESVEDNMSGPQWISLRYYVTKP
jgi:hypothetical protein